MSFETEVDKLWDSFNSDFIHNRMVIENYLWPNVIKKMDEVGINQSWRHDIWRNWTKELTNVERKPTRNLEWVDGCHAQLYDIYMCKDCGCVIHTRDDVADCLDPIYCPVCNKSKSFSWQYDVNDGSEHYKQLHTYLMHKKEYHRKMNHWFWKRLINLRTDIGWKKYKIKDFVLTKISKSYRLEKEQAMIRLFGEKK